MAATLSLNVPEHSLKTNLKTTQNVSKRERTKVSKYVEIGINTKPQHAIPHAPGTKPPESKDIAGHEISLKREQGIQPECLRLI